MRDFFEKYDIANEVIAVGVSGGADSLALALQMHECGLKVVALTVDHGLRQESYDEAQYVAKLMKSHQIEHHILSWKGAKPQTGIEEAAREARYNLLFDFCKKNHIKYLATGHHLRDQAETFLLRLARGSGLFGLSGILPVSERNGIIILRPQLDKSPDELRGYLTQKNITWIEDPMNDEEDYLRVKIRKFLPLMTQKIGIDDKRLAQTAAILQSSRLFLERCRDDFIAKYVRRFGDHVAGISLKRLVKTDAEIARLALSELVQKISGQPYPPEASAIIGIIEQGENFKGCTLSSCELEVAAGRLWIIPQDENPQPMSLQEWNDFVNRHHEFINSGLPYKVRKAIKKYWKD